MSRAVFVATFVLAMASVKGVRRADARMDATTECLVGFDGLGADVENGGTLECTDCDPTCDADGAGTSNGSCTFKLRVCANAADATCTATALKRVTVKGKCRASALAFRPSGTAPSCGAQSSLSVPLKRKRTKAGKCTITAKTLSAGKPRRVDKDVLTLVCNPRPAGESCPTTSTTTTTMPCPPPVTGTTSQCAPIVVGQPIPNTYKLEGTAAEKRCATMSAANRFATCNTDADCGGTTGACLALPWVTADGVVMPFPTGSRTTFTVNQADAFPTCEHGVCVPCGNPNAPCAGLPGCAVPGNPNGCALRATQGCCDHPGFTVPNFFVNILGGLCSRVDQIACGVGVINTSNPQTGDNEVSKMADTSDPGPDCTYGTPDDPAPIACALAGNDFKGKIVRTVGNGSGDANGIQFRLTTPELSTTWQDKQSPAGTCAPGATFDDGETLISQIVLKAEPTTAGASGSFTDQNGDQCSRTGAGFGGLIADGPITVGPAPTGPARPQPYDGSAGSVTAAVSEVFSAAAPLKDLGFVAITPNMPAVVVPTVSCCCTDTPGCPE